MKKSVYLPPPLAYTMRRYNLNWSEIAQKAWAKAIEDEEQNQFDRKVLEGMLGPYIPIKKVGK